MDHDCKRGVVALDLVLDLVGRNVDTSRTMGSTAIMAAWSAGPLVWWLVDRWSVQD